MQKRHNNDKSQIKVADAPISKDAYDSERFDRHRIDATRHDRKISRKSHPGEVFIHPNLKSCSADRFINRQAKTTLKNRNIRHTRQMIRKVRYHKAIEHETKAVAEGQVINSVGGEARTSNPMKADRKNFEVKGRKKVKLFYELWHHDWRDNSEEFIQTLQDYGVIA